MNSSERINAIASKITCNSYLEVGVQAGITFNAINTISHKVAVDPEFVFDYKNYESENVKFFQVPSDAFFQSNKNKFDIIFFRRFA